MRVKNLRMLVPAGGDGVSEHTHVFIHEHWLCGCSIASRMFPVIWTPFNLACVTVEC